MESRKKKSKSKTFDKAEDCINIFRWIDANLEFQPRGQLANKYVITVTKIENNGE